MNRIRRSLARQASPPGAAESPAAQPTGTAAARSGRPGRGGFAERFIQDMATAASVAAGHRLRRPGRGSWPTPIATTLWRHTVIRPGLLPHTVQLCIHCRQLPAGFWVSHSGGQSVRRPWCLSCCQQLDQDRYHMTPFDS